MDYHECVTPDVKTCSKCGKESPLDCFSLSKGKRKSECKDCFAAYHREYYAKNKAKVLQRTQKYKAENTEKVKALMADWYQRNKEHVSDRMKAYRSDPAVAAHEKARTAAYYDARKDAIQQKRKARLLSSQELLDRMAEYQLHHYQNNKFLYRARVAKRRAATIQATPKWANLEAIKMMYALAEWMTIQDGVQYHVDHIIPLQGKNVCGLHVEHNLQIMTATENKRKANKF